MTDFETYTVETAPEAVRPLMKNTRKTLGFVPTLSAPWPKRQHWRKLTSASPELSSGRRVVNASSAGTFIPTDL